jgi:hypothetical protein
VTLAAGGIVNGPTLANIGESGPEAVIPLSRLGAGGGNQRPVQITVNGYVGSQQQIVMALRNEFIRLGRASGPIFGTTGLG